VVQFLPKHPVEYRSRRNWRNHKERKLQSWHSLAANSG
jgi:hypothetical protein